MVNYIRTHNSKPEEIQAATVCEWNDEKYLKPVGGGETHVEWLMFGTYELTTKLYVECDRIHLSP